MVLAARSRTDYDRFLVDFPEDLERIRSQYPNRPSSNTPSIPPAYMAGLV
jgi:hypothetical protein